MTTSGAAFGQPLGAPGYRLVDSDTHINEPPDLWTSRVPQKLRERVPVMKSFDEGDAWVMDGVRDPINFGQNAAAGLMVEDRSAWVRWDEMRPGGYDPKARLAEMDSDLVDAALLYPTPRISQLVIGTKDPELHLAMVRAYNDWLSEYCEHDPSRLGGLFLVPNRGIDDAIGEIERIADRPGMVGALIGCYPHGDLDLVPEDDRVWHALVERQLSLNIHVKLDNALPEDIYTKAATASTRATAALRFNDAPTRMTQFIVGGVFDRIPELRVVFAEVDAGWVPYVKEQLDNRMLRYTVGREARGLEFPSAVIARHFYYTYITDHFAVQNRAAVGVERLMWSSDFPHVGSDWPNSVKVIHADFASVDPVERDMILGGNALTLYRFAS